jgi:hypothetical protein
MKGKYLVWLALVAVVTAAVFTFGCKALGGKAGEEKKTETITVEETPITETTVTETSLPEQPVYQPKKIDDLKMLDATLGSAVETLGWDNVFCFIALDKSVSLFTELQPAYAPGSADRNFIDASITDLGNIKTWLDEKINKGESVDPNGADAKDKRKKIADIRARVQAMIAGPAPKHEPVPEWKGDLMKKKYKEGGDMRKRKWAEGHKK